jgi:hypothetical protein
VLVTAIVQASRKRILDLDRTADMNVPASAAVKVWP